MVLAHRSIKRIMLVICFILFATLLWADPVDPNIRAVIIEYIGNHTNDDHLFHIKDTTSDIDRKLVFKKIYEKKVYAYKDDDYYRANFKDSASKESVDLDFTINNAITTPKIVNVMISKVNDEERQFYSTDNHPVGLAKVKVISEKDIKDLSPEMQKFFEESTKFPLQKKKQNP